MRNYWTCSKFADWIRGTEKLEVGTAEEWDNWHTTAKMRHNFRYWLAEEGLDYVQQFVMYIPDKLHSVKYYINNRYISRTHQLTAHARDIKPGDWCDVGHRFLPAMFNELVDFVEVELAWWHLAWNSEDRPKYNAPWWRFGWWNMRLWRCKEAGMDNLNWQAQLRHDDEYCKDEDFYGQFTSQALNAQEVIVLYKWWTEVRPARPDPMEASGWSAYCDALSDEFGKGAKWIGRQTSNPELKAEGDRAMKAMHKLEADYEKEDEEMMIRLIKVRHALWT